MSMRHRIPFIVATTVILLVGLALPAEARVMTRSYYLGSTFTSRPLNVCFSATANGTVTADGNQYKGSVWAWKAGSKLTNPTLTVYAYSCSSSKPVKLKKLVMEQKWVETTCTTGISIQAGFPWSIGVTPTVTCGRHNAARRSTTYTNVSSASQYNSGSPVKFTSPLRATAICFQPTITVTAYKGNISDTFDISPKAKACVRP